MAIRGGQLAAPTFLLDVNERLRRHDARLG
jgi:hypothetical protein